MTLRVELGRLVAGGSISAAATRNVPAWFWSVTSGSPPPSRVAPHRRGLLPCQREGLCDARGLDRTVFGCARRRDLRPVDELGFRRHRRPALRFPERARARGPRFGRRALGLHHAARWKLDSPDVDLAHGRRVGLRRLRRRVSADQFGSARALGPAPVLPVRIGDGRPLEERFRGGRLRGPPDSRGIGRLGDGTQRRAQRLPGASVRSTPIFSSQSEAAGHGWPCVGACWRSACWPSKRSSPFPFCCCSWTIGPCAASTACRRDGCSSKKFPFWPSRS